MSFSIKHLLFVMSVAAVGLAALTNADLPLVAGLVDLFTFSLIIVLAYGIWTSEGEQRAFRIGFVGWSASYLLLSKKISGTFEFTTYKLLAIAGDLLMPQRITAITGNAHFQARNYYVACFVDVGHCLFALLFGIIGGWMTVYFYRKRQRMLNQRGE